VRSGRQMMKVLTSDPLRMSLDDRQFRPDLLRPAF
jgi:hypothetical protein